MGSDGGVRALALFAGGLVLGVPVLQNDFAEELVGDFLGFDLQFGLDPVQATRVTLGQHVGAHLVRVKEMQHGAPRGGGAAGDRLKAQAHVRTGRGVRPDNRPASAPPTAPLHRRKRQSSETGLPRRRLLALSTLL